MPSSRERPGFSRRCSLGATASRSRSRTAISWLTTIWSAHKDAERLTEQVQVLQGEVIKLQEQGEENQRLKSLLDLKDKGTFPAGTDFIVARVMAKSPNKWQAWIEIDKGSDDGLTVDMAVVGSTPVAGEALAGKGLVGKITAVTAALRQGATHHRL